MPVTVPTVQMQTQFRFQGPIPLQHNVNVRPPGPRGVMMFASDIDYDGRKLRRTAMRKTVDYNAPVIRMLQARIWQRDYRDRDALQPDVLFTPHMLPPLSYEDNYTNAVTTRFAKAASNKVRCPVFCLAWTPEGRRLITGTSSGEFTLWNGLTFNFETILQAHDVPVRSMVWSHNDCWMVTGDHSGFIKYWQSNMNNVKMYQAHREAVRGVTFSPTDNKFATCSDDGTVRVWDFIRCEEEKVLRGHGGDVKCVDWHPYKSLVASGSKDSQQPVKLWDPRSGKCFGTLHAHKSTVMDARWNRNGNWLMTASRDHMLKLFDVRNFSAELQVFRGHKKEASVIAWHPFHEGLVCSGGTDGSILFWHVGTDKEIAAIEQAHDSIIWALAWHPMGHILCSGSNDHSSKYWSRNLPGDLMRDKYNINTNPYGGLMSLEDRCPDGYIPGMGPEDKVDMEKLQTNSIPGLENLISEEKGKSQRKIPYAKPIPKEFQAAWNDTRRSEEVRGFPSKPGQKELISKLIARPSSAKSLNELKSDCMYMYGKLIRIRPNTELERVTKSGLDNLLQFVHTGKVPELHDVMPYYDLTADPDVHNFNPNILQPASRKNQVRSFAEIEIPREYGIQNVDDTSGDNQHDYEGRSRSMYPSKMDTDMRMVPSGYANQGFYRNTNEPDIRNHRRQENYPNGQDSWNNSRYDSARAGAGPSFQNKNFGPSRSAPQNFNQGNTYPSSNYGRYSNVDSRVPNHKPGQPLLGNRPSNFASMQNEINMGYDYDDDQYAMNNDTMDVDQYAEEEDWGNEDNDYGNNYEYNAPPQREVPLSRGMRPMRGRSLRSRGPRSSDRGRRGGLSRGGPRSVLRGASSAPRGRGRGDTRTRRPTRAKSFRGR